MKTFNKETLILYAVTDRSWLCDGERLSDAVRAALNGGATLIQLREKNMSEDEFLSSAKEMLAVCAEYGVPLIINDNVEVCKKSGADGVHLGQGDMNAAEARRILGDSKIIGVTAKTVEQALRAQKDGADYIGSGAVFGTSTKHDAKKMEIATLKSITAAVDIPVVAIGGIDSSNIERLRGCGISGAAVVSGIFAKNNIEQSTRDLKRRIETVI